MDDLKLIAGAMILYGIRCWARAWYSAITRRTA